MNSSRFYQVANRLSVNPRQGCRLSYCDRTNVVGAGRTSGANCSSVLTYYRDLVGLDRYFSSSLLPHAPSIVLSRRGLRYNERRVGFAAEPPANFALEIMLRSVWKSFNGP